MHKVSPLLVIVLAIVAGAACCAWCMTSGQPARTPGPTLAATPTAQFSICGIKMITKDVNSGNDGILTVMGDVSPCYAVGNLVAVTRPNKPTPKPLHWSHIDKVEVTSTPEGAVFTKVSLKTPYHDPVIYPSYLMLPAERLEGHK